jgi:Arc/MetJ-type ribon-helix-helix transcriptional regulator
MRTSKTVSISLPPSQLKEAERMARKQNRTMSELFREAFRKYQEQEGVRQYQLQKLKGLFEETRTEAERNGTVTITDAEIAAEVRAHRQAKRQRVKKPVK